MPQHPASPMIAPEDTTDFKPIAIALFLIACMLLGIPIFQLRARGQKSKQKHSTSIRPDVSDVNPALDAFEALYEEPRRRTSGSLDVDHAPEGTANSNNANATSTIQTTRVASRARATAAQSTNATNIQLRPPNNAIPHALIRTRLTLVAAYHARENNLDLLIADITLAIEMALHHGLMTLWLAFVMRRSLRKAYAGDEIDQGNGDGDGRDEHEHEGDDEAVWVWGIWEHDDDDSNGRCLSIAAGKRKAQMRELQVLENVLREIENLSKQEMREKALHHSVYADEPVREGWFRGVRPWP